MFELPQRLILCGALLAGGAGASAATVTLFDDAPGTLPAAQGWLLYASNGFLNGGSASQSAAAGLGAFLTTDTVVAAGYSNTTPFLNTFVNPAFPMLDRTAGFRLSFELGILGENHNSTDRAGFSVIALASDGLGVELGFWSDEIWAQTSAFTHAEGSAIVSGSAQRSYQLEISGATYSLSDGAGEILGGALRDYSGAGFAPYTLASYLFLGDNTSRAGAEVVLGAVVLETFAPVPLPAPLLLLVSGLIWLQRRHAR